MTLEVDTDDKKSAGDNANNTQNESGSQADADADALNPPKRRRNRWGSAQPVVEESSSTEVKVEDVVNVTTEQKNTIEPPVEQPKPRRSRWEAKEVVHDVPASSAPPVQSEEAQQHALVLKLKLGHINDKLLTVSRDAAAMEQDPNRSPSPQPKYDAQGKRTNTREMRMREALNKEKSKIIEELMSLNPGFQAPVDFVKTKPFRKLYIPYKEFPQKNFIGLIIGPRGNTQKQMETETNCKISIRGKGSVKGWKATSVDDDDELHVHIQGDELANVERAVKLVENILKFSDEATLEEHKQKQLRELAMINGTLREEEFCSICGEKGHRQFECPTRLRSIKKAGIKCAICGDMSHPTRDCPMKQEGPVNEVVLDSEYNSFMAELDGNTMPKSTGAKKSSSNLNDIDDDESNNNSGNTDSSKPTQTIITSTLFFGGSMPSMPPPPPPTSMLGVPPLPLQPGLSGSAPSEAVPPVAPSYGYGYPTDSYYQHHAYGYPPQPPVPNTATTADTTDYSAYGYQYPGYAGYPWCPPAAGDASAYYPPQQQHDAQYYSHDGSYYPPAPDMPPPPQ